MKSLTKEEEEIMGFSLHQQIFVERTVPGLTVRHLLSFVWWLRRKHLDII